MSTPLWFRQWSSTACRASSRAEVWYRSHAHCWYKNGSKTCWYATKAKQTGRRKTVLCVCGVRVCSTTAWDRCRPAAQKVAATIRHLSHKRDHHTGVCKPAEHLQSMGNEGGQTRCRTPQHQNMCRTGRSSELPCMLRVLLPCCQQSMASPIGPCCGMMLPVTAAAAGHQQHCGCGGSPGSVFGDDGQPPGSTLWVCW